MIDKEPETKIPGHILHKFNQIKRPVELYETASPDSIREFVRYIDAIKGDATLAHVEEDFLYAHLLSLIAMGDCDDPQGCAEEAIKTIEIQFRRVCEG